MAYTVQWLVDGPNTSNVEPDGRIVSKYKRTYLYKTTSLTPPTDAQITTDVGISPGSPHPDDSNATCKAVEISHGVGPTKCPHFARHVTVEWATNAPVPNVVDTDPTTRRVLWDLSTSAQSRYIVQDRNGNMILNAAGQPFDGGVPVSFRVGIAVAQINRDATGYDKGTVMRYSGNLNSDTYLGAAAGTLQLDIKAKEHYEGSFHWWEETYTFSYDPLGWQPKPMNAGFFALDSYGELNRIINSDLGDANDPTAPVQEPEPLTVAGALLPIADRPANCNFIDVDYYPTTAFSAFGL